MFLIVLTNYRFSIFVLLLDVAFVVMIFQQLNFDWWSDLLLKAVDEGPQLGQNSESI